MARRRRRAPLAARNTQNQGPEPPITPRLMPRVWTSRSPMKAAMPPAMISVVLADATWSRASPSSSRNLASRSSRVMGVVGAVRTAIGLPLRLGDPGGGERGQSGRHHEHDEIRQPRQVAVEGGAGLRLQRPQCRQHQQHHPEADQHCAGAAERQVTADALERIDGLLAGVVLGERPQLGCDLGDGLRLRLRHLGPAPRRWGCVARDVWLYHAGTDVPGDTDRWWPSSDYPPARRARTRTIWSVNTSRSRAQRAWTVR